MSKPIPNKVQNEAKIRDKFFIPVDNIVRNERHCTLSQKLVVNIICKGKEVGYLEIPNLNDPILDEGNNIKWDRIYKLYKKEIDAQVLKIYPDAKITQNKKRELIILDKQAQRTKEWFYEGCNWIIK